MVTGPGSSDRAPGPSGLCPDCVHVRVIESAHSRFFLCRRSKLDGRFAKYPPQPVVACNGFERYGCDPKGAAPSGEETS